MISTPQSNTLQISVLGDLYFLYVKCMKFLFYSKFRSFFHFFFFFFTFFRFLSLIQFEDILLDNLNIKK